MPIRLPSPLALACAAALLAPAAPFAQNASPSPAEPPSSPAAAVTAASAPAAGAATPLRSLPYTPVLDPASMDPGASACEDFYRYTCGGWQKNNPIPSDQASWDVYAKMTQDNQQVLWGILDRLASEPTGRTPDQQKIGDAFAACTDEGAVEALGARPLAPQLALVEGMKSKADLAAVLADLHARTGDESLFFSFASGQDYADSTRVIAFANPGGLGLPTRDYYFKADAQSRALRDAYAAHVARMFVLLGDDEASAKREAGVVMAIETALARGTMTPVEQRDPQKQFHKADLRGLQAVTPDFRWKDYLDRSGLSGNDAFNISEPKFYRAFEQQLRTRSLSDLKTYLRWHVAHASAPFLSKAFVDENFAFFRKTLHGVPEQAPRWRRCVSLIDQQLGDALGQEFVKLTFAPELKVRTRHMTKQIEEAMESEIRHLDWMSPQTKTKALEKLHGIVNKVGYPDQWRNYAALEIRRDDYLGNVERGSRFEKARQLAKIGKPVDRGEWGMTAQTVNAYYDAQMNDINFPAGVLQPPLFDAKLDDAPNYGNTGGTIGHELTHGFDDEGRQFDATGNLRNWWTRKDAAEFDKRTTCLTDQYAKFVIVDDIHINSKLTLGEDLADFGGLVLALIAYHAEEAQSAHPDTPRDGFTPDQRFFIGMAQWACSNERPEDLRVRAVNEPHSPNRYRVNGLVSNFVEFEKAFNCKPGQPMAPVKRCSVW